MTDYTITVPSGSPEAIKKAAGQLRTVAHDLDTHSTMIKAEQSGMAKAWKSPGGKAATTEAGTICGSATSYSGHINNGATALTTFATALDTAQSTIGGLQKQAAGAPGEARSEAAKYPIYHHLPPQDQEDWVDGLVADKMKPIMAKYHEALGTLATAGTTCKTALTKEIPGYKAGMTPGQITTATAKSLERTLPILHAHNQAITLKNILSDGKVSDGERTQLAEIAHDLATHKGDEAYLREFYSDVPPGSIQKIPLALHDMHSDGPVLTDSDKDIIGDFGTSLAALSRIGGVHDKGEGYTIAARALGDLRNGDLPGVGLLFTYSTRNGRRGQWNSVLAADAAEGALLWRQKYQDYYYGVVGNIYAPDVISNGGGKDGNSYWFDVWGLSYKGGDDNDAIKDLDPAINILTNINQNHDDWAARAIASQKLPNNVDSNWALPNGMTHNGGNTGTFVDLMVVPDWIDGGTAAGDTLKLATEAVRTGPDGAVSAQIMQNVMKDTAWWEDNKGKLISDAKDNYAACSIFDINKGNDWNDQHVDLGPGMKQDFAHMAVQYIPALAGDKNAIDADHADIDPVTGEMYRSVTGDTAAKFMQSFIGDEKYRVTLLGGGEEWSRQMIAQGLTGHGLTTQQAAQQSGWFYGNVAKAYGNVLGGQKDDMTQAHNEVANNLKLARDAFTTATGFGGATTTIPNFLFTTYTDQMFSDYDSSLQKKLQELSAQSDAFKDSAGGTAYSNTAEALYIDRNHDITVGQGATAHKVAIGDIVIRGPEGPNGEASHVKLSDCYNPDGTVKPQYAADLQDWIQHNTDDLTGGDNSTDPVTGSKIVDWYESAFDHQG